MNEKEAAMHEELIIKYRACMEVLGNLEKEKRGIDARLKTINEDMKPLIKTKQRLEKKIKETIEQKNKYDFAITILEKL